RLYVAQVGPVGGHVDHEVLDHPHGTHGHDDDLVAPARHLHADAVRADQLAVAVDDHGARATDGRATGAPEGQRVVDVVLDKGQTVEDGRLLGEVELVGLQVRGF